MLLLLLLLSSSSTSIQMRNYCLLVKYRTVSFKIRFMAPIGYSYLWAI